MLHGDFFEEATGDPDISVKMFKWAEEKDPYSLKFVNDYNVLLYDTEEYGKSPFVMMKLAYQRALSFQLHSSDSRPAEQRCSSVWNRNTSSLGPRPNRPGKSGECNEEALGQVLSAHVDHGV